MRRRVGAIRTVRVSRIIDAPIEFVYRWCTDFREDDYRITGSRSRKRILEKTRQRVIYTTREIGAKYVGSASIVALHPPDNWHLYSTGNNRDQEGDYHLTKLPGRRTKLDMVFRVKRKSSTAPTKLQLFHHLKEAWDKYAAELEKDYRRQTR